MVVEGMSGVSLLDQGGGHDDGGMALGGAGEGTIAAGGDAVGEFVAAEYGARVPNRKVWDCEGGIQDCGGGR